MTRLTGLAAIQAKMEADDARREGSGDYVKADWFKLADKQAAKVVFLQEMDQSSPNYSEKNGLGQVVVEHSNPQNFKRKAECTLEDEGACWACEQHRKDYKAKWGQKSRLYINVLILESPQLATFETADPKVVVLSQGLGDGQISQALFEQAGEFGTITDRVFKIKRSGAGFNDTSYVLTALTAHDLNVEDYEVYDLDKIIRKVPYDQQAAHYLDAASGSSESTGSDESREPVGAGVGAGPQPDDADTW